MMDEKDRREWSEALRRLSLLMSGGWIVTSMGHPWGPGTDEDYRVTLANVLTHDRISVYGPDLASAITKAVNAAAKKDSTFRSVEEQIAAKAGEGRHA